MEVIINAKTKKLVLAASIAAMFGGASVPALADELADKLYEKGVLTEEEYNELKGSDDDMSGSFKGGLKWKSADGQHEFLVHGRVQLDYRTSDLPESIDDFDVRRAYLGVKGKFYKDWSYEVTGDWGRPSPRMEYAYLNYKWNDAVQARAGHFKFPYGFSQVTSSRFTDFMERSFTDDYEPGKDTGVMVYGQPKKNVFSYSLGYANGGGGRQDAPDTETKDIIFRGAVNFAPMINLDDTVLHLGVDYRDGEFRPDPDDFPTYGGAKFDRTTNGIEGVAAWGPFKLQSEFQTIDLSTDDSDFPDVDVYYVNAMWMITGERYAKSYSIDGMKSIKPLKSLSAGGMGAWEVGVQFANLDADQSTDGELNLDSTTLGVKWIPEENVRFLLNWVENDFETPITVNGQSVDKETQVNLRAQIYF